MAEPLAERLRPRSLDDYIGQKHLVGEGAVLRKMIDAGRISSFILWGPPGVGKTTLAQIIANKLQAQFYTLSAVTSGVKDVREVIERAQKGRFFNEASPILFIDEIHRFSKSQQDSLLGAVEKGIVTLIGATTENPSFEVIRPLLSRCQLYVLKSLEKEDLQELLQRAITKDIILKERKIELKETSAMMRYSGGDARKLLNILELVVESSSNDEIVITDSIVEECLQQNPLAYDKDGEMHYDIISAFIKSGPYDRGWGRPAVHSAQTGYFGCRGHWIGESQCAVAGKCRFRRCDEDRMARRSHTVGRMCRLSGHIAQEQFSISGHRSRVGIGAKDGQPACAVAPAQCANIVDERPGI